MGRLKSSADMVAQGEANAYEHARGLLETAIKQDEATCQWLRNQLATIQTELMLLSHSLMNTLFTMKVMVQI
jgi:hypothetical protein